MSSLAPRRVALGAVVGLALAACGRPERPDILLISIDTLRADSLGSHGYRRPTSPFLDQLAARGVRFENAYANTLATAPSHASILSSQYQESHGVLFDSRRADGTEAASVPDSIVLLPEVLADAGYQTLAVTAGGSFRARFGFGQGFDEFESYSSGGVVRGIQRLLAMLDRHLSRRAPRFLLFHTYEVHSPYDPPPPWDEHFGELPASDFMPFSGRLRALIDTAGQELAPADFAKIRQLYDSGIRFTDEALRGLFEELEARGFFDGDYLVVVTSDHGEEFGERGGVLHRGLLYEEFLHVPLILQAARAPAGQVRPDLVSSVDIAPTILAYAGLPVPASMQGGDLLAPPPPPERQVVVSQYRGTRYAVRTPRWKLIGPQHPELYDLASDPGERHDLAGREPERVAELLALLEAWRAAQLDARPAGPEAGELTAEELEQMRALGYVD